MTHHSDTDAFDDLRFLAGHALRNAGESGPVCDGVKLRIARLESKLNEVERFRRLERDFTREVGPGRPVVTNKEAPAVVTREHRVLAWLKLNKRLHSELDYEGSAWIADGADGGPPNFEREQLLAAGIAIGEARGASRAAVPETELSDARDALLASDWDVEPTVAECIKRLADEVNLLRQANEKLATDLGFASHAREALAKDMAALADGEAVRLDLADRVRHRIDTLRQRIAELESEQTRHAEICSGWEERAPDELERLNPYKYQHIVHEVPPQQPASFIHGVRYYLGMLENGDNWSHSLGHIEELCKEFQSAIDARAGKDQTPPDDDQLREALALLWSFVERCDGTRFEAANAHNVISTALFAKRPAKELLADLALLRRGVGNLDLSRIAALDRVEAHIRGAAK